MNVSEAKYLNKDAVQNRVTHRWRVCCSCINIRRAWEHDANRSNNRKVRQGLKRNMGNEENLGPLLV